MTTFLIGDTHFGHYGATQFLRADGITKMRPFDTVEEMDEVMVDNWNKVVKPKDKVYHLGDVVINRKSFSTLARLNGEKVLIKGNHDCLDELTECLTRRGWKHYDQLLDTDLVFSINPQNNLGEWKPIKYKIVNEHNGNMWQLESERMSMSVTENHRVMFRNSEFGKILYSKPADIKGVMYIPTSVSDNAGDYDISDAYIKALAWYYTDGCLNKHKGENRAISIYQSKPSGIKRLEEVLAEAGIGYVKDSQGVTLKGTSVVGKMLIKDSLESYVYRIPVSQSEKLLAYAHKERYQLPDWIYNLSAKQVNLFIKEVIEGDGSWATNGYKTAAVVHGCLEFLNQLQILCVTKGINANITKFRDSDYRLNVNFRKTSKVYSTSTLAKKHRWGVINYNGKVWCIGTEHTNFMVRRNGQTFFTGNCFRINEYLTYFKDVRSYHPLDKYLLSHIPVHSDSLGRWKGNWHGHLHEKIVWLDGEPDKRYMCLSVEHINYTPISLEDAILMWEKQQQQ